jgi:hypothetical protein
MKIEVNKKSLTQFFADIDEPGAVFEWDERVCMVIGAIRCPPAPPRPDIWLNAVDLVTGRLLPVPGDVKVMPVEAKLNIDAFFIDPV